MRPSRIVLSLAAFSAACFLGLLGAAEFDDAFLDESLLSFEVSDLLVPGAPVGTRDDAALEPDPGSGLYPSSGALAGAVRARLEAEPRGSDGILVMMPIGIEGRITAYADWLGGRRVSSILDELRTEVRAERADERAGGRSPGR
jgi:hypothetical protein